MTPADAPPTDDELLARWRAGGQDAAAELAARHAPGLLAMVRGRLSARVAVRVDPEDVVQSALKSFFVAARDDGLAAGHSGDLWRLLATITLNKMLKVVRWHTVGRRTVRAEAGPAADADTPTPDGLSPLETLAVLDTLDAVLADVPADRRPIVELRLAGHDLESIAAAVGCSQRTVRRVLDQVKAGLDRLRREDEP